MEDSVSLKEKTQRFLELEIVQRENQKHVFQSYLNTNLSVLVEKKSDKRDFQFSGHSTCQKVVNFEGNSELLGKIIDVKITECKSNTLFGVVHK